MVHASLAESQPRPVHEASTRVRKMVQWVLISAGETRKARHITNGASAVTVSLLVLLACVTTPALLKCSSVVFFITASPTFPQLLIFRAAAPHSLLSPVIHYCHHPARMSLEGTLNGAVLAREIQCD